MKPKIVSAAMIAVILINILMVASGIPLTMADANVDRLEDDHPAAHKSGNFSIQKDPHYAVQDLDSGYESFQGNDSEASPSGEDTFTPRENRSYYQGVLNETNEWIDYATGDNGSAEIVVGVNHSKTNSYQELKRLIAETDGQLANEIAVEGQVRAAVADIPLKLVSSFVGRVRDAGVSRYVEPNREFQISLLPDDPYWSYQWGPAKIEADYAWNITTGDPSVLVAVIDTGIDYNHPDLAANYMPLGYDWVHEDPDPMDDHGHGTHCAGIIAAVLNNSRGIAGLAQVSIMAEKAFSSHGTGSEDDLAEAIYHAVNQSADILSNSWGGYGESLLIQEAIQYAYQNDVLVIAAAGNSRTDLKHFPAAYEEVIAVSATDRYDDPAFFTNFGDWIELAAPGVDIYSTVWDNSYTYMSGTSMACPHVAGVSALVWSRFPNASRDWVRLWLRYTADDLGTPDFDPYYGYGRINGRKSVEYSPPEHEVIIAGWDAPPYVEPNSTGIFNIKLLNFGAEAESNLTVQLFVNGSIVDSTTVGPLEAGDYKTVNCYWTPTQEGRYNVTSYVVPVAGEIVTENNRVCSYIFVGSPVKAFVLDSAGTEFADVLSTWQVLNTNWYQFGGRMVYIDYTTLDKEDITYQDLADADADVLIISCACSAYYGWEFTDSEIAAIKRYVHEGHGLIATAGTLYYWDVPNNNKLAPLFGLNRTVRWSATITDLLHLQNTTHPLFWNVPDPHIFPEVGTALPLDGRWDYNELTDGEYLALGHYRESAIVTYRGLVFISPWFEVIPAYYHHHLQLLYNAITWSRYQKPEHELGVSLEAPPALKPGTSTTLNVTVSNLGLKNETNIQLILLIDDNPVCNITIPQLTNGSSHTHSHLWSPTREGKYNVTAYAPPITGEETLSNNAESADVLVYTTLVALFKNVDPWDYTANEELLSENHIPYVVLKSEDFRSIKLNTFAKVVICSDQDQPFYNAIEEHRGWFEDYANNGGLLEIHAADLGWHGGQWIGLLPGGLEYIPISSDMVTVADPEHPVLNVPHRITSEELDYWYYSVHGHFQSYPPTSHIILNADYFYNYFPALLEFQYGDGHIIACSQTLEWGYRQRYSPLLENLLLYYRYSHELAVFLEAPLWLEPFSSSLLSATVYNFGLENESDVELRIMIDGSTVAHTIVPLLTTGSSQTITYLWNPTTIREYNITAYAPPVTGENFTIDNQVTRMADVRPPILILFDQTHGTDSIFHYGVWIESLAERGYIIETHDRASITGEALSSYDIFVVPQARHSYSSTELSAIQDFVLDGHGFLVVGDDYPDIYTSLTDFANITWVSGGRGGYTTDITPHPVTDGVDTAFFSSPVSRLLVESPAEDLIRDEKGYVMLAASEVGDGKVIGIADEHSINNHYISYADNLRLANNMIGWLFSLPEHDLRVTLESPRLLEPEASSILNITLQNRGLKEETDVALYLLMNDTQVSSAENITLGAGERHTLNYTWTPAATGTYNISGWTPPAPGDAYPENNKVCKMSKVTYIPRVAVLASWDIPPYFTGGWSNDYQTLVDALNNEGIYTRAVTNKEITNGILNGFDVFVMVDNVPNLDSVPYVTNFWSRGGGVVAFDSSICFLCYSGILPPESAGDHGYYTYWDYGTSSEAQIAYVHPVTEGYKLGQVIHGTAGDAEYKVEELVNTTAFPSYTMLVEDTTRPDRAYVSAYEPDAGRVIHIWDQHHWRNSGLQKMILNAMFWTPAPVADGAVHNLTVYPTEVYVGQTVNINVTIANEGETSENFTVTAYHGNVSSPKPPSSPPYPAGPRISLDPSENIFHLNETSIGHRFNVTAWVENAMSLGGAQIQLHFNDTILNVTRWFTVDEGDGGFMPSPITAFPEPPTPSYDHIGPGEGRVRLAVSKGGLPPTAPWGHDGKICILEFNITAVPPMGGSLSSTLHINNTYTYLLDTTANKIPDVIKEDGSYWLGHGLPPTPFIGEQTVYLPPMSNRTLAILWDTTGLPLGNYTVSAVVEPLVGERDIEDNCFTDGVVEILWQHDVAIRQLYCNRTWVYQGRNVTFTAEVENNGDFTENVTVILYYNLTSNSIIGNVTIPDLNPDQEETIRVVWNTTNVIPCVNYTITGVVSTGNPDSNPGDNRLEDGSVKIRYLGDLNGDDRIDLKDVFSVALAFGCLPGDPKWNPDYDINSDYQIDLKDVFSVAIRYGEC